MEKITLNNGIEMPRLGYGTYQIPPSRTQQCVETALQIGYRLIDTAQCYGNEREVGRACRSLGIERRELFITTKLWGCRDYADTLRSIAGSLQRLGCDYIDLLLIHEPVGRVAEIWRAMEHFYRQGLLRAVGISNFMEEAYCSLLPHCRVVPAVNQVETHIFRQQDSLRQLEAQHGTRHECWSPLACGRGGIFTEPRLCSIAAVHDCTLAQAALAFLLQQDIIAIPKSCSAGHMQENWEAQNITLTPGELQSLRSLDRGHSLFNWW